MSRDPSSALHAPVALFAYNRPASLRRVIDDLRTQGSITTLYLFSDGPVDDADAARVEEVRDILRGVDWPERVHLSESPQNLGLARSITRGLSKVLDDNDRVVVVEDDVGLAPGAFRFLAEALDKFRGDPQVASVTAFRHPVRSQAIEGLDEDAFFLRRFSSWGWGTWRDVWNTMDLSLAASKDMLTPNLLEKSRKAGTDVVSMVVDYCEGRLGDTWAVPVTIQLLEREMLTLHPKRNMVMNYGLDGGVHFSEPPRWGSRLRWEPSPERDFRFPDVSAVDGGVERSYARFVSRYGKRALHTRVADRLTRRRRPSSHQ